MVRFGAKKVETSPPFLFDLISIVAYQSKKSDYYKKMCAERSMCPIILPARTQNVSFYFVQSCSPFPQYMHQL